MLDIINTAIADFIAGKSVKGYKVRDREMNFQNMTLDELKALRDDYERRVAKETATANGLKRKVLVRF